MFYSHGPCNEPVCSRRSQDGSGSRVWGSLTQETKSKAENWKVSRSHLYPK